MEEIKTLKDHVYNYIAEQIRTGGMHPNQRVSETAICEALKNQLGIQFPPGLAPSAGDFKWERVK